MRRIGATVGIGAGQMSRVDSSRIAARKALDAAEAAGLAEPLTKGSVVASDAFFPFADGLLSAVEAGATAVIQPGGSMRDEEVIAAADAARHRHGVHRRQAFPALSDPRSRGGKVCPPDRASPTARPSRRAGTKDHRHAQARRAAEGGDGGDDEGREETRRPAGQRIDAEVAAGLVGGHAARQVGSRRSLHRTEGDADQQAETM